jgi:hypothetical protein
MRLFFVVVLLAVAGCGDIARVSAPAGPSGRLYLAGRSPGTLTRVDTATGAVSVMTGVRALGGGDPPFMVAFTGGRLVTFALGRSTSFAPDLGSSRSLGEAWFYVPSATPGRVWTILKTPGSNVTFRGVREVGVDGRVYLARRWQIPGWPVGAVSDGLVVQRRRLEVWDPLTHKRVRRVPGTFPVAFRGNVVASIQDETLFIDDRAIMGRFDPAWMGAFSPDGSLLAVRSGRGIAIVDVATGTVTTVPGARTDRFYGRLAWASSGWLFWNAGGGRLGAWRPGEPARRLGVKVGPLVDMTAD